MLFLFQYIQLLFLQFGPYLGIGFFEKETVLAGYVTYLLQYLNRRAAQYTTVFDIEKNKETIRWNNLMAVLQVLNIKVEFKSPLTK